MGPVLSHKLGDPLLAAVQAEVKAKEAPFGPAQMETFRAHVAEDIRRHRELLTSGGFPKGTPLTDPDQIKQVEAKIAHLQRIHDAILPKIGEKAGVEFPTAPAPPAPKPAPPEGMQPIKPDVLAKAAKIKAAMATAPPQAALVAAQKAFEMLAMAAFGKTTNLTGAQKAWLQKKFDDLR